MTATTALQGFIYPTIDDRPCDMTTTFATFAAQVDAKMAGLDADLLRASKPSMVRISGTALAFDSNLGGNAHRPLVNLGVLEINRGTPTDLTLRQDAIALPAGLWVVGCDLIYHNKAAATQDYILRLLTGAGPMTNTGPQHVERDGGTDPEVLWGATGESLDVHDLALTTGASTYFSADISWTTTQFVLFDYYALWAVKIADNP
jgi:hypothetical protein